jgi:hypothetical protein
MFADFLPPAEERTILQVKEGEGRWKGWRRLVVLMILLMLEGEALPCGQWDGPQFRMINREILFGNILLQNEKVRYNSFMTGICRSGFSSLQDVCLRAGLYLHILLFLTPP